MNALETDAQQVLRMEADAILNLIPRVDEHFDAAVNLILACPGRVVLTGMGKSGTKSVTDASSSPDSRVLCAISLISVKLVVLLTQNAGSPVSLSWHSSSLNSRDANRTSIKSSTLNKS